MGSPAPSRLADLHLTTVSIESFNVVLLQIGQNYGFETSCQGREKKCLKNEV